MFASLLDLGDEPAPSGGDVAAPSEVLEEISAGAPIEETTSEKTEEVSISPVAPPFSVAPPPSVAAPEPVDLGSSPLVGDRPPSRDDMPAQKHKGGSGKWIAGIAVLAAAVAFGAVYLAKTKPWQEAQPESVPVAAVTPAAKATPPAPEPAKPAAAAGAVEKKPAAEETKHTAGEKAASEKPASEKSAEEKAAAEKTPPEKAEKAEKTAEAKAEPESSSSKSSGKSGGKAGGKGGEEKAGTNEEAYRLVLRSVPTGAEVLIDGEYFARTPCERRILDPKKSFAITIRREGYEPHERLLGPSDNWVKKGNERVLNVTVNLKRVKAHPAVAAPSPAPAVPEATATRAPEAKSSPTPAEAAKPEPAKPEAAKPAAPAETKAPSPKPEAAKPEAAKPAAPAPAPAAKPAVSKPVPNFDEQGKAKE